MVLTSAVRRRSLRVLRAPAACSRVGGGVRINTIGRGLGLVLWLVVVLVLVLVLG